MLTKGIIPDASTRWAKYRIGYHIVWTPKYRRRTLRDDVIKTLKASLTSAATTAGFTIMAMEADADHVHVFVSAKPSVSPSEVVRILKGASSQAVRKAHPDIAKVSAAKGLWAQSYFVGTVGDMSASTVRHYIENCQGL